MAPLKPADIFVIQSAIEQYKRKHPGKPTPSAEVALAWMMERRRGSLRKRSREDGLFSRVLDNVRFLFRPLTTP